MLSGREIPGAEHPFGVNATGFSDLAYNQACDRLLLAGVDPGIRTAAIEAMQQSFDLNLPALPLYQPPRLVAFQPGLCGVELHTFSESALWNVEAWSRGGNCP